ncbi:NlpC/P60 family protein [Oceanobacillus massiliensis]|uniref:C40 family peptidase n=1 Tax=Oceanobacillus massiliensis TaxID=1465765 RepID=UPI0002891BBC|nr:C40 family peptidase [Oceanobacillus massiliensis]
MKKTLITLTTVAVVGLGSTLFTGTTHAETVQELKTKQSEIQQDREALLAKLTDAEGQMADLLIELETLNEKIEELDAAMVENQKQMDKIKTSIADKESEIDALEEEIVKLEEAIEARFEILKERAVSYQQNGGEISYLEVIFGSKNFGDFISRVSAVNKITESDADLMKKQEEDKKAVEEKKTAVISKLDELKDMEVELEGVLALIDEQKAENESRKEELEMKQEDIIALKENLQLEDSQLASLEQDVKASLRAAIDPAPAVAVASATVGEADSSESGGKLEALSKKTSSARPAASGNISTAINAGFSHLGTPYVWAGKSPSGFDCSGFVSWAFAQAGISIPSSTSQLSSFGTKVSASNMQPGDIVFFNTYKTNGHVGIYLGGGKFIGAQNSTGLAVADMSSGYWAGKFNGHVRSVK